MRLIAEGLAHSGVPVEVATTDDNGPQRLDVPLGTPVVERNVTYWFFPRQLRPYNFSAPLFSWLWQHISDFDLVHIHAVFSYASTAAAFVAHHRRVPYVVRPLGVLNRYGMQTLKPGFKRVSFALIERRILERAAVVHYTAEQERIEAEELGFHAKPAIIGNPIRLMEPGEKAQATRNPDGRRILFMSRLDKKKGLELLIQAFARIRRCIPGSTLVIAGSGDSRFEQEIRSQAEREGVSGSVHWAGFVAGVAKQEALASASVFVLPSYSENFGVAVVEAMAAGLPVVISDQTGIHPDVTKYQAGLVTPCAVAPLAEAVCRILADPDAGRAMGERGRQFAMSEFSVQAVSQKLLALYRSILRN